MTDEPENPRAVSGDNKPPLSEQLATRFEEQLKQVEEIAARATAAPRAIEDEAQHNDLAQIVKDARTLTKTLDSHFKAEKAPWLEGGRTVDSFFKEPRERLDRIMSGMEKRIKAHLDAKAAAERARLAEEARQARERELAAQREADARLAEAAKARQNADVHETKMVEAATASALAAAHGSEARDAEKQSEAKPAELARTRTEAGLSTLQTFWDFEIVDLEAVSLVKLRPFIKEEHIEMAVRSFVKTHGGSQQIPGVRIFQQTKANVR